MIRLDTVNRTLKLFLGTAQTTAALQIVVSYSDQTTSAYLGGTQLSNSNGTTAVTICSAPAASTIRDIDMVNVLNTDTVSKVVTIQLVDTSTAYVLVSVTLLVGEKLTYTHGSGWQVVDNSGNVKYVVLSSSGVNSFSAGSTGLTPVTATTGAVTLGGTLAVASGGTGTATPSLVAGTNVSISGTWPNQTVNATGGTVSSVAATVPSFLSITGSPITTSGTLAIGYSGTALPVANGGTGVTASSGINSVVLRDSNANISVNSISEGYSNVAAAGTTTTLTAASAPNYVVTGSGGQTYQLPDATTLSNGVNYTFNNNQSSGTIVVKNNSGTTVSTIQSGGLVDISLLSNSIAAGSWDVHNLAPSNVSWSTNTFDYPGSITSATWNGVAVAVNRGGTGLTSTPANGALDIGNGTNFTRTTLTAGTGITVTNASGSITIASSVTPVTSVTGTSPVSSSGGTAPAISLSTGYGDTQNPYASKTANYVLASPDGTSGAPTFRAIVAADIPTLNQNTTGTAANVSGTVAVANGGTGATTAATARSNLSAAQSGANTDISSVTLTSGTISTAPSASTDIVNKSYADSIASGINFHNACNLATTAALPANTYNNGTSGVGATLTATANAVLSIDSVAVTSGQRILVKNESTGANNGVYTVTQVGSVSLPYILTRATDYDTSGSGTNEIDQGDLLLVLSGTVNSNTSWVQQTALPITVGTTALVFIQFAAVQTYTAGTGLNLTTNQFSIANTGTAGTYGSASSVPVIVTNAQGQVTGVTNTTIAIAGSAVTGNISGNAANVTGTVAVANGGTGLTAGTSGGIPYYSSTSAITSSALLDANALMVGGGAGATPATVTTGTGVVTALGVNTGSSGAFVVNGGALGTPSSGTVTNLTGTASININGTVGATTTNSGAFTSLSYSTTLTGGTGVITIGTNQFYKDASGNIGIGTTSPGEKVDVLGNIAVGVTSAANRVNFHRPADSVLGTYVGYHTASNSDFGLFNVSGGGNIRLIGNGGNLIFESTSGTERFRITSSGGASFGSTGTAYGSSGQVLTSNGNASPTWGTLGIGAGGTGQTTASAAFNALSPVTTTGDLIVGNGTNSATRLAIGANNYVLTSNGTTAVWAANTGGTGISTGKSIAMAMIFGF